MEHKAENQQTVNPGNWKDLVRVLKQQTSTYAQFLKFLSDKEKALIKGDMKALNALVKKENEFISKLEDLEDTRIETTAQCLGGGSPSLRELLEKCPEKHRPELEEAAISLMETLNRVAITNKSNAELIGAAMEFVNYQINLFSTSTAPVESTYESTGRVRQQELKLKSILNKQV